MTIQNESNIATAPKEKANSKKRNIKKKKRLGATKREQLDNNKYENQKVQKQQGEDKDSCPTCTKYVGEGVKCRVCDRLIHCRCEDITQQQVGLDYPDKIPYIRVWIRGNLSRK